LWAERFDGALEDVFHLQDQVAASVASAIAPKLEQAEIMRAKRKPTESLTVQREVDLGKRRRMTAREKGETVAIFYGINPRTLEVESVYVTRDGHMTKHRTYNGEPTIHDH
jgi:hypothetical protein